MLTATSSMKAWVARHCGLSYLTDIIHAFKYSTAAGGRLDDLRSLVEVPPDFLAAAERPAGLEPAALLLAEGEEDIDGDMLV
jgi:hypothetical protein